MGIFCFFFTLFLSSFCIRLLRDFFVCLKLCMKCHRHHVPAQSHYTEGTERVSLFVVMLVGFQFHFYLGVIEILGWVIHLCSQYFKEVEQRIVSLCRVLLGSENISGWFLCYL